MDTLRMVEIDCYKNSQSLETHKVYINVDQVNYITDTHMEKNQDRHVSYGLVMGNGIILETYHDLPGLLKSSLINAQKL